MSDSNDVSDLNDSPSHTSSLSSKIIRRKHNATFKKAQSVHTIIRSPSLKKSDTSLMPSPDSSLTDFDNNFLNKSANATPKASLGSHNNPIKVNLTNFMLINSGTISNSNAICINKTDLLLENSIVLDHIRYGNDFVHIDDEKYFVTFKSSTMNMPINISGIDSKGMNNIVNARGFFDYYNNIINALNLQKQTGHIYKSAHNLFTKIDSFQNDQYTQNINTLIGQLNKRLTQSTNLLVDYHKKCKSYLLQYGDLLEQEKSITNSGSKNKLEKINEKKNKLKKSYFDMQDKIINEEKKLNELYSVINLQRKKIFNDYQSEIKALIDEINQALTIQNLNKGDRKNFLTLLRFIRAQDAFYNYSKEQHIYYFHLNYLLSLQHISEYYLDVFDDQQQDQCDWLRVMILSFQEYNHQFRTDPDLSKDQDKAYLNKYLFQANQLSSSNESGVERGCNIDSKITQFNKHEVSQRMHLMTNHTINQAKNTSSWRDMSFTKAGGVGGGIGLLIGGCVAVGLIIITGSFFALLAIPLTIILYGFSVGGVVKLNHHILKDPIVLQNDDESISSDVSKVVDESPQPKTVATTSSLYKAMESSEETLSSWSAPVNDSQISPRQNMNDDSFIDRREQDMPCNQGSASKNQTLETNNKFKKQ